MTSAGALERQRRRILVRAATWQWALRSYYARNAYVLGINVYTLIVTLALARNIVHVRRQTLSRSSSSIRHASLTILAATRRSEQCASPASPHHHATCPRGSLLILGTGCPLSSRGPSLRTWLRETRCCLASSSRDASTAPPPSPVLRGLELFRPREALAPTLIAGTCLWAGA